MGVWETCRFIFYSQQFSSHFPFNLLVLELLSHPGALSPGGDVVVVGLADRDEPSLLLRVLGQQGGHQLPLQDPKRDHYLYWREREREIIDRQKD